MTDIARHFSRVELAEAAEQLLADRRRGDLEAVKRNVFTPEKAAQRERCAVAVAEILRAVVEHRSPYDAEQRWLESDGAQGAIWYEIRADLNAVAEAARIAALQPGTPPAAEQRALKLIAIAELFQPAVDGGTAPLILTIAFVEMALRRGKANSEERSAAPAAPAPSRVRQQRAAGGLFG